LQPPWEGGIIRDLLIGDHPPASLRDWRYAATAFLAGGFVFFLYRTQQAIPESLIVILDAAGLSLFAVAGTEKALAFEINPLIAVLLGLSLAWVEERFATCCWRRFPWCCAPMSTPPPRFLGRLPWSSPGD
jgi:hypothetical protein